MAAKFWVGGTGNLDGSDTTHISDTSGGAGGATYPAAGDDLTFDAASGGGTVTFTATLSITNLTMGAFTGTVNTNGQTVNVSTTFSISGTGTRTVTLGASAINVAAWSAATTTNLTFNANTSTITQNSAFAFSGGGLTYNNVVFTGSSVATHAGANTFANLTKTGAATKTDTFTWSSDQTVSGTFTVNGNSSVNRVLVRSGTRGTARTITAAVVTITNADFQDITGAGAGSWNLSAITGLSGDCGGNSGITFTTPVTNYWIGSAGNVDAVAEWASSSGGAPSSGRVPLPQDSAVVDANSGTGTITQNMSRIGSWNFTGSSGITWTTSTAASFFGSINLAALGTLTGSTQAYTYEGRGASILTSAGNAWAKTFAVDAPGGSLTLGDAFVDTAALTVTSGTFSDGGFNVTVPNFVSTGTATRVVTFGTGTTWTLNGDVANIWSATSTGITLNPGSGTIRITSALGAARTFAGGGIATYPHFVNASSGAFALQFTGSNTFMTFTVDASGAARTVLFTAGTTTTMTDFLRDVAGTNVITIGSITAASHALVLTGGGIVDGLDWLDISRSDATPALLTWYAGANSVDSGNNTGWIFTDPPPPAGGTGNMLLLGVGS